MGNRKNDHAVEVFVIRVDGDFYRITQPGFQVVIPRWSEQDPEAAEQADAVVELPDGTCHYATFMTLNAIATVMDGQGVTGERGGGQYLWCRDLIIMRRPGFAAITDAVQDLIGRGELAAACRQVESAPLLARP